jgi:hypothetical protein
MTFGMKATLGWDLYKVEKPESKSDIKLFGEVDGEMRWHPVYEAIFWSHHIINESISHLTRGNAYEYMDITDYVKRAAGPFAPGERYVVADEFSHLQEEARVHVFDDFFQHNKLFGPKAVKISDGYSILNVVTHEQMKRDTGRNMGNVYDGPIKNVNFHYDPVTDTRTYLKFAQFAISATTYRNDRFLREAQRAMIGEELGNLKAISVGESKKNWKAGGLDTFFEKLDRDFESGIAEIADFLRSEMGKPYHEKMIDYAVFRSGFKSGARKIHQFKTKDGGVASSFEDAVYPTDINGEDDIVRISNRTMRLQTVTYQDTIDPEKVIPTQLLYILGALPNNYEVISAINRALGNKVREHRGFIGDLNADFGNRKAYLNNIGRSRIAEKQYGGKYMALVQSMRIHPDVLREKHIQNFVSETNDFLKPTMPGANYIQSPSTMDIYIRKIKVMGKEIEQPYLFEDAIKLVEGSFQPGDNIPGFTMRKINPRTYKAKNGKDAVTRENVLANPDAYQYIKEELIAAFPYINKFGLYRDTPKGEATSMQQTLVEAFTIHDVDGQPINFYGFDRAQVAEALSAIDVRNAFLSLSSSQRKAIIGVASVKEFNAWMSDRTDVELVHRMAGYFESLNQALDSFLVRIPTANARDGSSSRLVAFIYDSANTVLVSPLKNLLDGTDFDIDAIQVYYRPMEIRKTITDKNGNKKDVVEVDPMQQTIFENIIKYYDDSQNAPMILDPNDLESFRKIAENSKTKFNIYASNPGGMVQSTVINQAGTNLVGHYANLMNFMLRLFTHYNAYQHGKMDKTLSGLENIKILDGSPEEVRERIIKAIQLTSKFINAATDNAKEGGLLGRLNVNESTTAVVHGMILSGLTEEEIFDELLNNQELIDASVSAMRSRIANNMFPTRIHSYLENPVLKKYAYMGEQLRRLGDIVALQQGIKADSAE